MPTSAHLKAAAFAAGLLTCAPALAESASVVRIVDGLDRPANFTFVAELNRFFVLEQHTGRVRIVEDGRLFPAPLVDISDRLGASLESEEGLLGVAVRTAAPHELYLAYASEQGPLALVRLALSGDGAEVITGSEERLLEVARRGPWHTCGHVIFGPDGLLYLCVGDTAHADGAQDLSMHSGSILRIDVTGSRRPYTVPADNPFVGNPDARPEIWMYGLRNPWRFSFDEAARQVIVPDVGWNAWEEINLANIAAPGANFGWPHAEGNECVAWDPTNCAGDQLTWPAFEYHHVVAAPAGCSIIGGTVYSGARSPEWQGVYVFGDFCSGEVWAIKDLHRPNRRIRKLVSAEINPSAIGEGPDGEIYFTDPLRGSLSRIDLPGDFDAGWEDLSALHNEAVTTARRAADVALLHFLNSRADLYGSPHSAIRQSPALVRVLAWHDAIGRPSLRQMMVAASVAAVLGLALLAGFVWMALRLRSVSRGRAGAEHT